MRWSRPAARARRWRNGKHPLKGMADSGWGSLVTALRQVLAGRRDVALLHALDEKDGIILRAILAGLQDPASLPTCRPAAATRKWPRPHWPPW